MTTPEPEQIDREAAANIWRDYCAKTGEIIVERNMRAGGLDESLPAILAAHRRLGIEQGKRMAGEWQDIATFDDKAGPTVLWGKLYAYNATPEEIAKEEPRVCLLAYTYEEDGVRWYASTETYYGSETWYVLPTHWMPLPAAPGSEPTPSLRARHYAECRAGIVDWLYETGKNLPDEDDRWEGVLWAAESLERGDHLIKEDKPHGAS